MRNFKGKFLNTCNKKENIFVNYFSKRKRVRVALDRKLLNCKISWPKTFQQILTKIYHNNFYYCRKNVKIANITLFFKVHLLAFDTRKVKYQPWPVVKYFINNKLACYSQRLFINIIRRYENTTMYF